MAQPFMAQPQTVPPHAMVVQVQPAVVQPGVVQGTKDWNSGLFGCFEDMKSCECVLRIKILNRNRNNGKYTMHDQQQFVFSTALANFVKLFCFYGF